MLRYFLFAVGATLITGCGGQDQPSTYPTSGVVTLAGEPVEGATVVFHPESGPLATAITDSAGQFELQTFEPEDGAVPGQHNVTVGKDAIVVESNDPESLAELEAAESEIPERYSDPSTSGLTATVEESGENYFEFSIQAE